jgi:hypothetical protein
MASAYIDHGYAVMKLSANELDAVRLAQLDGDVRALPTADASILLARHTLDSGEALHKKAVEAQSGFAQARADVERSAQRVWRNSAIGFVCVALSSWVAANLGFTWLRRRVSTTAATA